MGYPEKPDLDRSSGGRPSFWVAVVALVVIMATGMLFVPALFATRTHVHIPPFPMAATEQRIEYFPSDLHVEIDRQGQCFINGDAVSLDQVETRARTVVRHFPQNLQDAHISVVKDCPFEHVQKVLTIYRQLGIENPRLSTVPPRREVIVELDADGKATVDGEPTPEVNRVLAQIASEHGSRASVILRAHPQCPFEAVARVNDQCSQLKFGGVRVEAAQGDAVSCEHEP